MKVLFTTIFVLFLGSLVLAQDAGKNWFQIYGFAMTDAGYNVNQINPDWYDVLRPSKLPTYKNQYGTDGNTYLSARQTRFGVKSFTPTEMGDFTTVFDFDLFGVGPDAGVTTIRLRHAYGQLGHFGAGQTESAFMDLDVFPNTFEYWGPCGMLFYRNVQVRWIPIIGETNLVFALEQPGASADQGVYSDFEQLASVKAHYPLPDLSGHYRRAMDWGYIQLGGMVRSIQWKDQSTGIEDTIDLSGSAVGWGVSLSSGIKFGEKALLHLQGIYGEGVENYFNDAPVDIGIKNNFSDPTKPIKGEALPDVGIVAFLDINWTSQFMSSVGYSTTIITNSDGQAYDAYHKGQFVEANLIYSPVPNVLTGVELQWADRENYNNLPEGSEYPDEYLKTTDIFKVQFSFKYSFSHKITF
jgi:hypothetical protein